MNKSVTLWIAIVAALCVCFTATYCLTPAGEKPHPQISEDAVSHEYFEDILTIDDGTLISVSVTGSDGPGDGYNPFDVKKTGNKTYMIFGTPDIAGEYTIDVTVESNTSDYVGMLQKITATFTINVS